MASLPRAWRPVRNVGRATGDLLEDVGKQLQFYASIVYEMITQFVLR